MRVRREMITIDEEKCTGCGECVPNCPEGALQVLDGKARLVSDLFCDGLGACLGHCPEGAITIEEREAEPYDERHVMANIVRQGPAVVAAHLDHLRSHGAMAYLADALAFLKEHGIPAPRGEPRTPNLPKALEPSGGGGCPGARAMALGNREAPSHAPPARPAQSQLANWPVQITLVPPSAPWFQGADLLIAADCVGFAYPSFHEDLLRGKVLLVGCPKLDDAESYRQKLAQIFAQNDLRSIEVAYMEVPCCYGLVRLVQLALADSKKDIPLVLTQIGIRGAIVERAEQKALAREVAP